MDDLTASELVQHLAQALRSFCQNKVAFETYARFTGNLFLTIDTSETVDFLFNEQILKTTAHTFSYESRSSHVLVRQDKSNYEVNEFENGHNNVEQYRNGTDADKDKLVIQRSIFGSNKRYGSNHEVPVKQEQVASKNESFSEGPLTFPYDVSNANSIFDEATFVPVPSDEISSTLSDAGVLKNKDAFMDQTHHNENTTESSAKRFACKICDKRFARKDTLSQHERTHFDEKQFKCSICGKGFIRKDRMLQHEFIHSGQKPFECKLCDKKFPTKDRLTRHEQVHFGEKPFACSVCDRRFARKDGLLQHELTHSTDTVACKICNKRFNHISKLIKHEIIHSDQNPYTCKVCKRGFARKDNLVIHERLHSDTKPFICRICDKGFIRKDKLAQHERTHFSSVSFEEHNSSINSLENDSAFPPQQNTSSSHPYEDNSQRFITKDKLVHHETTNFSSVSFEEHNSAINSIENDAGFPPQQNTSSHPYEDHGQMSNL